MRWDRHGHGLCAWAAAADGWRVRGRGRAPPAGARAGSCGEAPAIDRPTRPTGGRKRTPHQLRSCLPERRRPTARERAVTRGGGAFF
jgi:hypothetical protein